MIIVILIIIFFVAYFIIHMKIDNLRHRANQHILGKVGLGSSDVNQKINESQERKYLQKLLNDYPYFNEKLIKDTLYGYATDITKKVSNNYFAEKVVEKMSKDQLSSSFVNMNFVRINVVYYKNPRFSVAVVYTDGRDEYQMTMYATIRENQLYIDSYDVTKGLVKGF